MTFDKKWGKHPQKLFHEFTHSHTGIRLRNVHNRWIELFLLEVCIADDYGGQRERRGSYENIPHVEDE